MKRFWKILRVIMVVLLFIVVGLPIAIYILVSTPWAQNEIRNVANNQLTGLLGSEVEIGRVDYHPFNVLAVKSVNVKDDYGKVALSIGQISARFELLQFLRDGRLVFDYAVVDALDLKIYKKSQDQPLNIQCIINRLKPKDSNKPPTAFDLKVDVVMLRNGHATYDIESEEQVKDKFDANHIEVGDLSLYAYVRHASNNDYDILVDDLKFNEKSGFVVEHIGASVKVDTARFEVNDFKVLLPNSQIALAPISIPTERLGDVVTTLRSQEINIRPSSPISLSTSDFECFVPELINHEREINLDFDIDASLQSATVKDLRIRDNKGVDINIAAFVENLDNIEDISTKVHQFDIDLPVNAVSEFIKESNIRNKLGSFDRINLSGSGYADMQSANVDLSTLIDDAAIDIVASATTDDKYKSVEYSVSSEIQDFDLSKVIGDKFGMFATVIDAKGSISKGDFSVDGNVELYNWGWNGHNYRDIQIDGLYDTKSGKLAMDIDSKDSLAIFAIDLDAVLQKDFNTVALDLDVNSIDLNALNLDAKHSGYVLRAKINSELQGSSVDDIEGHMNIADVNYCDAEGNGLAIDKFNLLANRSITPELITIDSDFLKGKIEGNLTPSTLVASLRDMVAHVVPGLLEDNKDFHQYLAENSEVNNDFVVDMTLQNAERVSNFFNLPIHIIYPVEISGLVNSVSGRANLMFDAPYLQQGDKIIESTVFNLGVDDEIDYASLYMTTKMPTKKGPMTVVLGVNGANNRFDTDVDWLIERKVPLNGEINFSTELSRSLNENICVSTTFNPGQINFGDDVWVISPSNIEWCDSTLSVRNFSLTAGEQKITIDGTGSSLLDDVLNIELSSIQLESIFETLEIDKALIGGCATGAFEARQILSKTPVLTTDNLHVDSIGYNYCTLGTGDITANWDNDKQAFFLKADIINQEGLPSQIYGNIFPMKESLDLYFDAQHIKVGFMRPFMEAFTSHVSGYVSGNAHLFGTFKNVDMEGDLYTEDLKLKIDFTNTYYTATDSIHIRPGRIDLDNITITDIYGNKAKLNGYLKHDYFHAPVFDFRVSDAENFLSYDVTSAQSPVWYGKIFGNGSASVVGRPGRIDIGVDMSTAPQSVFTFVLSDQLEAEQYSFITFNDRTTISEEERQRMEDRIPAVVREYQSKMLAKEEDTPSTYVMDIKVDITQDANLNIIMDPVGGDCISGNGIGDLHMTYNSSDNDLYMAGKYSVERGTYNFTLQDIIIKNFTINPGSTISFKGDPYAAQLDIEAVYSVNANLSDLDESFTQDKELTRTNVPVQALLKVTGDMRQPDITFDLNFPTLKSDTYRKVRSIISTDDMMNRQIIYLLALNRFYTPEYMASTTNGNELFSVASSTISSQLSSILGKLSDKWSIAPNLRSDRGDFSDIEVDVALSSRLLNNRLLFNGNFGYRDKSLNTNQFIGDFDIQYLLNRSGTWRLRAYSRFNDQNYYLRTAATTQGVGIMFRRDFDRLFPNRKPVLQADTVLTNIIVPKDTVLIPAENE